MSSYAVVWREDGGPARPGKAEIRGCALRLEGAGRVVALPLGEVAAMRVGRAPEERVDGRPTLVVEQRDGRIVTISSVGEVGALFELAETIAALQLDESALGEKVVVIVPLRRGSRERVGALLEQGPPFDLDALSVDRHEVFLTDRDAVFVFEAQAGSRVVERLLAEPGLWKAAAAWSRHMAGPPRIAETIFSWERARPPPEGAAAASVG